MKILVIIVTYNGMKWIERCLSSLSASSVQAEVVVIDNGSSDGTREYVPSTFPDVTWMPQDKNLGFGQGNNVGLRYALDAGADYVLLLNQDASVSATAIEEMLAVSDGTNVVSPVQMNGDGSKLDYMFKKAICKKNTDIVEDILSGKPLKEAYRIGEVAAACWFMPISILRTVGGFNPLFFHYGEDNNYYQRMVYHKRSMTLATKAKIYHDREVHGNIAVYNDKFVQRELLKIVSNINETAMKKFLDIIRLWARCYAYYLPTGRYRIGRITSALFRTLCNGRKIHRSVMKEKEIGATWIR